MDRILLNRMLLISRNKRVLIKFSLLSFFTVLNSLNIANAAITAETANIIHGNPPELFVTESTLGKLGFVYRGTDYNEKLGNITSSTTKFFEQTTKLTEFTPKLFENFVERQTKDDLNGDYYDDDADSFALEEPITYTLTNVWKDSNNKIVKEEDYDNIACSHNKYTMPLQLFVTVDNIKLHTQYGVPNESEVIQPITKAFKISLAGTCFAKPGGILLDPSTQWRSIKNDYTDLDPAWNLTDIGIGGVPKNKPNSKFGGGYTDDYEPNQGFKVKPTVSSKTFPTTGFKGANFQLVMDGLQQDYTYSSNNPNIKVDNDGIVSLDTATSGATITATLKSEPQYSFEYKFAISMWVQPLKLNIYSSSDAERTCHDLNQEALTRRDLNNSSEFAYKNLDGITDMEYNLFTRGIGLGVFSEWGRLLNAPTTVSGTIFLPVSYPKSDWIFAWYVTSESHTITRKNTDNNTEVTVEEPILVASHDGMISYDSAWKTGIAPIPVTTVCKRTY